MNSLPVAPFTLQPIQTRVRWKLIDLFLILVTTIFLTIVTLVVFFLALALLTRLPIELPGLISFPSLPALLQRRALLLGMFMGAVFYVILFLSVIIWVVGRRHASFQDIGFRMPSLRAIISIPVFFLANMLFLVMVNAITTYFTGPFENPQMAIFQNAGEFSWFNFIATFFTLAIVAPIVEETLFRGVLYQWLRARTNVVVAIILTAAIFGAAHGIPLIFPSLFAVGLVLTIAFEWSKSIWVNIAVHAMQNGLVVLLVFFLMAFPQA
ncbi:MAG: CPBP family intramembrane metalloprotease [Chloroflexi bacterium]|nr:CPBP family intramembrane metalloprotease [Chloroflexota bacterium]